MSELHERKRLPDTRDSITHKATIIDDYGGETDVYFTVGLYADGTPGELFISVGKQGSTLKGVVDSFAIALSMGLQYGVPLDSIIRKFKTAYFEPSGRIQSDSGIETCKSIVDYLAHWLELRFPQ